MSNLHNQLTMAVIGSDCNNFLTSFCNFSEKAVGLKNKLSEIDGLFKKIDLYLQGHEELFINEVLYESHPQLNKMTSILKNEFDNRTNGITPDEALEEIINLLSPSYMEHPLAINLAQQAIGAGLRAGCDDFNPIMELSNKLPAPIHGLIAGSAAGLVQYLFNYPFFNSDIQKIKQIEKYRLLLAIKRFYNSTPSKEGLSRFEKLKPQIENILGEQRNVLGRILQRQTKSMLTFNKIVIPTTTPTTTPTTNYVTSTEHINLLNALFQNDSNLLVEKANAANNKIQETPDNKQKESQILWKTLNKPAYYRKVFKYAGRQTYLTPLEQIYSDNNKTIIQDIYLNSINKTRTDPILKDEKTLYNFLKEKLDQITKINAIQTMNEIKIIIDIALEASADNEHKKKITDVYHNLMSFQFDVNHGHIFKIANQHNQNCAVLHASIIGLRYGLHNISLNEAITNNNSAESVSRWMFFQLFGNLDRSGLVSSYISRTHTFNTCEAIHQQIIEQFTDVSDMEHRTIGISASELLSINQQPSTTTQDNKRYYYNRYCELSKQDGMILPNIIHEFLNNMGAAPEKFNTTDIIKNFGMLATDIGIINEEDINCSIHKFNELAVKLFHGNSKNNESQISSPQHPLISILLLFYLAKQDQNSNSKTEKLAIINRLIEKSTHDTSSLLYKTIKPSVLKYFAFEMSVAIITSTLYGASVISTNPLLMPIQVIVNYFRLALNDADFLEKLIRNLSTTNRNQALEVIVASLKEKEQDQNIIYEFLEKNQIARSSLEKAENSYQQLISDQATIETKTSKLRNEFINDFNNISTMKTYINAIVTQLNLEADSVHLNRVMAIRNFVILLRIVLHNDNNKEPFGPEIKILCLNYILELLKSKKLSSQLAMEELSWSKSFTKFENIIGAVLTLMPKFCGEVISNIISGTLIGASLDATNSTSGVILRHYINKFQIYSENYQQLIDIVEKEIECEKAIQ